MILLVFGVCSYQAHHLVEQSPRTTRVAMPLPLSSNPYTGSIAWFLLLGLARALRALELRCLGILAKKSTRETTLGLEIAPSTPGARDLNREGDELNRGGGVDEHS